MDNWIQNDMQKFRTIRQRCGEKEKALGSYALAMIKILNGLSEMEYTRFHVYESTAILRGMRLFSKYCMEQIEEALTLNANVPEKKNIIDDIEKAISNISKVYKDMVNSVSDINRQMLQSLPLDTNIHESSPKIAAFYAELLEQLVDIFQENDHIYAFVPYHTVGCVSETQILFQARKDSGKIVIVNIADGIFESYDATAICLVHEAFHVLTKKARKRQKRASLLYYQMICYMEQRLFRNVDFYVEARGNIRHIIIPKLMERWFHQEKDFINELNENVLNEEEEKKFYGQNIKAQINLRIKSVLLNIDETIEKEVLKVIDDEFAMDSYDEYQKMQNKGRKIAAKIRKNLLQIIYGQEVEKGSQFFLNIYRETYADMACVLICQLSEQSYEKAFEQSIQFEYEEDSFVDRLKILRKKIVAEAVKGYLPAEKADGWKKCIETTEEHQEESQMEYVEVKERTGQKNSSCVTVNLTEQIRGAFESYLRECAKEFSKEIKEEKSLETFRRGIDSIISESQKVLSAILSGDERVPFVKKLWRQ